MSAYLVRDEHINVLVHALDEYSTDHYVHIQSTVSYDLPLLGKEAKDRVGQILRDENVRSVNERYDDDRMVFYQYAAPAHDFSPVEILKAIDCYEYQSCESKTWPTSPAASIIAGLRSLAISRLPGYDDASWDITKSTAPIAQ